MEESGIILDYYVSPHTKKSRPVEEKDIPTVNNDRGIMQRLCHTPVGMYTGGMAVAHSQVEEKDPLRFFVLADGRCVINPEIINHTKTTVDSIEGCLSFPEEKPKTVQRFNKIEVGFYSLEKDRMVKNKLDLNGSLSKIFQHEIGHLDGEYIYEIPTNEAN